MEAEAINLRRKRFREEVVCGDQDFRASARMIRHDGCPIGFFFLEFGGIKEEESEDDSVEKIYPQAALQNEVGLGPDDIPKRTKENDVIRNREVVIVNVDDFYISGTESSRRRYAKRMNERFRRGPPRGGFRDLFRVGYT